MKPSLVEPRPGFPGACATVEALRKAADERTLLKHVVTATDIGYFVAMLCSPLTIGVHGEAIGVDGGNRADMHY